MYALATKTFLNLFGHITKNSYKLSDKSHTLENVCEVYINLVERKTPKENAEKKVLENLF